ncbi:MAG TPA: M1 family peptidase, partial [Ferruginibacter sp.]|nr:M1 family peptidase [Ferruginibacter sp.]
KIDLRKIFDQYLRTTQVPVLEYKIEGHKLSYRYDSCVKEFNMPLKIKFKTEQWIKPTAEWKSLDLYPEGDNSFSVDPNFYIKTKKVD